jgi:hypothetical protein
MNESDRTELAQLRERQAQLESDLRRLSQQLRSFEQRATENTTQQQPRTEASPTVNPSPATLPPKLPPIIPGFSTPVNPVNPGQQTTLPPLAAISTADAGATAHSMAHSAVLRTARGTPDDATFS